MENCSHILCNAICGAKKKHVPRGAKTTTGARKPLPADHENTFVIGEAETSCVAPTDQQFSDDDVKSKSVTPALKPLERLSIPSVVPTAIAPPPLIALELTPTPNVVPATDATLPYISDL